MCQNVTSRRKCDIKTPSSSASVPFLGTPSRFMCKSRLRPSCGMSSKISLRKPHCGFFSCGTSLRMPAASWTSRRSTLWSQILLLCTTHIIVVFMHECVHVSVCAYVCPCVSLHVSFFLSFVHFVFAYVHGLMEIRMYVWFCSCA